MGRPATQAPPKPKADGATWVEISARFRPRSETILVPLDGDVLGQLAELERQLGQAVQQYRGDVVKVLSVELEALRERAAADAAEFTFVALPAAVWRRLVALYPSADPKLRWDSEQFAPALLAASCSTPALTTLPREEFLDRVKAATRKDVAELEALMGPALELTKQWSPAVVDVLVGLALTVNEGPVTAVPSSVREVSHG